MGEVDIVKELLYENSSHYIEKVNKSRFSEGILFGYTFIAIFLDDIIDPATILYRIRSIVHDHIRCLARGMDMDITIAEERLKYT